MKYMIRQMAFDSRIFLESQFFVGIASDSKFITKRLNKKIKSNFLFSLAIRLILSFNFYFHPQIMRGRMLSRIQKYSCNKFSIPILYILTTLLHNHILQAPCKYKNHNCRMVTLRSVIMKRLEKILSLSNKEWLLQERQ